VLALVMSRLYKFKDDAVSIGTNLMQDITEIGHLIAYNIGV
jgi:hypothetical protein